jgi:hypothetical protein
MIRLIGIDGDKGSGKDTLAEILVRQFGFTIVPFAKPMKDMLCEVFELDSRTLNDRVLKEAPFEVPMELSRTHILRIIEDLLWRGISVTPEMQADCLTMVGLKLATPREMMQIVAHDMVREKINYDTWVNLWCKEQAKYDKVVAPDARYPNERDAITVRSGKNVLVLRPDLCKNDGHVSENSHGREADYDAMVYKFAMWYTHIKHIGYRL